MLNLSTQFLGLTLSNPIISAAGPWNGNADGVQKSIDAGAAMVITETISQEEYPRISPSIYYNDGEVLNTLLYGHLSLEQWESEFEKIHKHQSKLVCSIRGGTPSELAYIARKAERMGADALQLDLFAPVGSCGFDLTADLQQFTQLVQAVEKSVKIPFFVRLPYYSVDNREFLATIKKIPVKAVTLVESIRGIHGIDLSTGKAIMQTFGGYSGKHIRPITLAAIASLGQVSDVDISAAGGIEDYKNVLECIMLGASTIQLGSSILLNGYSHITETLSKLEDWLCANNYHSFDEIRGKALSSIVPYEVLNCSINTVSTDKTGN